MNHLNEIGEQALSACKTLLKQYESGTKYNFDADDCSLCRIGPPEVCSFCPWLVFGKQ